MEIRKFFSRENYLVKGIATRLEGRRERTYPISSLEALPLIGGSVIAYSRNSEKTWHYARLEEHPQISAFTLVGEVHQGVSLFDELVPLRRGERPVSTTSALLAVDFVTSTFSARTTTRREVKRKRFSYD